MKLNGLMRWGFLYFVCGIAGANTLGAEPWPAPIQEKFSERVALLYWSDRVMPLLDLTVTFGRGSIADPKGKSGLSELAGLAFNLSEEDSGLKAVGATRSLNIEEDSVTLSIHGLGHHRQELWLGMQRSINQLRELNLTADRFKDLQLSLLSRLRHLMESPLGILSLVFRKEVVAGTPYDVGANPRTEDVGGLKPEDLRQWSKTLFGAPRIWIAVVGRGELAPNSGSTSLGLGKKLGIPEGLVELLSRQGPVAPSSVKSHQTSPSALQVIRKKPSPSRVKPAGPMVLGQEVILVHHPVGAQALIRMGFRLDSREKKIDSKGRAALALINTWLAGSSRARLQRPLREKLPVSYGLQAQLTENPDLVIWSIFTSTRQEMVGALLSELGAALKEILLEGRSRITVPELQAAKQILLGNYSASLASLNAMASKWLSGEILGRGGAGEFDEWMDAIDAVSAEEVNAVFDEYFLNAQPVTVVVGNKDRVGPSLSAAKIKTRIQVL